jgi:hypothetical protein
MDRARWPTSFGPAVALLGVSGTLLTGGVILTVAMVAVGLVPEVRTFTDLDREPSTRQAPPVRAAERELR